MRELISWVQSYMVCGDIREAARYTVLASASADAENRTEVEEAVWILCLLRRTRL